MTFALKEIYIANEKNRDANVKFVSLIKEADPLYKFKNKPVKSRKILINSNETSDESLKNKYKDIEEHLVGINEYMHILDTHIHFENEMQYSQFINEIADKMFD